MRTRCKPYSSNSVRRCKTASRVHQETWYDDGGWKKAGVYDRASCGYIKTSTSPAANAQVEFRIDCDNVTFSETDVAVIPNYKKVAAALLKKNSPRIRRRDLAKPSAVHSQYIHDERRATKDIS